MPEHINERNVPMDEAERNRLRAECSTNRVSDMSDDLVSRAKAALEGVESWSMVGDWACYEVDHCTCDGPHDTYGHRPECGLEPFAQTSQPVVALAVAARSLVPELVAEHELLVGRLKAFGRDCVHHGDMTPAAERMLIKILDGAR